MNTPADDAVVIRPFAPGDAQAFRDLNLAWIAAYFQPEAKDEATLSDPEGTILAPGGQILLADVGGQTVGCVALMPMPDGPINCYEVAKMAVAPEAQGRGVGRRLLEAAVAWARGGCTWKATPAWPPPCACTSRRASATCRPNRVLCPPTPAPTSSWRCFGKTERPEAPETRLAISAAACV